MLEHASVLPEITEPFQREVASFRSASFNNDPLLYPGERPVGSYVTDGTTVTSLHVESNAEHESLTFTVTSPEGEQDIDTYLAEHGAAPMADRIPVLAYGANMAPASLLSKFTKIGRPDALVVPNTYVDLKGFDVVWSAGPGMNGNFIASLYAGPETEDTSVEVGVTFLTREQLLVLHATELAYDLHRVDTEVDGVTLPAYFYAGKDHVYVEDGRPVAIDTIPAKGRDLSQANTAQMLSKIIAKPGLTDEVKSFKPDFEEAIQTPEDYMAFIEAIKPVKNLRTKMKKHLHEWLATQGSSKLVDVSDAEVMSWTNPSTLQTFGEWQTGQAPSEVYTLPTSELPIEQWPDAEARNKVLRGLSEHFHRHYPKNT